MLAALGTMFALGWRIVTKRFFGTFVIISVLIGFALESTFDIYENILLLVGRNPTLTDRTIVWADVLAMQHRPIFGYGFESFWLGERLDLLWEKWW